MPSRHLSACGGASHKFLNLSNSDFCRFLIPEVINLDTFSPLQRTQSIIIGVQLL